MAEIIAVSAQYTKTGKNIGRLTSISNRRTPKPPSGPGFLAGTFPGGITSVEGVPTTATVRVSYRPVAGGASDGVLIAQVQSAPDGTWRVDGLDPALKFDVICRKDGYNDMILSDISPVPYTP